LPLQFLIELLRLGRRRDRETIDVCLVRLSDTPALGRFVDWFAVTADLLCGMEELGEGLRVQASLPLPINDWPQATQAALVRILYATGAVDAAVTNCDDLRPQVADRATERAEGTMRSLLTPSPWSWAVGEVALAAEGIAVGKPEVNGIEPAPVPPCGWEGSYFPSVETVADFIQWIDLQFLEQDFLGAKGDQPSDGSLVRNSFRLIIKLQLADMPLEPRGPFTLHEELTLLRNLRRLCAGRIPEVQHTQDPAEANDKQRLGLNLLSDRHEAKRNGRSVEFHGRNVAWNIFVQLHQRYPGYYPALDLGHQTCNEDWQGDDPGMNTVYNHISELNQILKPLGVRAKHTRPMGYRLEVCAS
jgi:hypothetical protein